MKILWLSHLVPYPPKGGVLQRSHHLVKELSRYHDIYLLAFIQKDLINATFKDYQSGITEAEQKLNEYCRLVKFIPIPCERSRTGKLWLAFKSLFSSNSYTVNWLDSIEYQSAIKELKNQVNFDFVHADTISLAPYINYFPNSKTSLDHHNIESHMLIRRIPHETNILKKAYFYIEALKLQRYEKSVCKRFDLNITCSSLDSKRLLEISPEVKVEAVPNGVDIDYFHNSGQTSNKPNSLIFIGTLNWYPNIQAVEYIAEKLWPKLKQAIPDINIDIIGAYPPQSILALSEKDPNFRVHGFVDDILPFLERSSLYLCPIQDGGGTKLKILDALSMGKAIVAHPIACEGIEVSDGHNVAFASNPDEYLEKIKQLLNDRAKRQQLEQNARTLAVEHYSYDAIGRQLSELITKC